MDKFISDTQIIMSSDVNDQKQITHTFQQMQQKRGRGRPRKNQIANENRKLKKNKTIQSKQLIKSANKKDIEDEIILHLPISFKDLHTTQIENDCNIVNEFINDNTNIFTINDMNSNDSDSDSLNNEQNDIIIHELKQKLKDKEKLINTMEKEISEYKNLLTENSINGVNTRKVTKMNTNFIHSVTGNELVVETTDIACWWCTYNFDTMPCFIPDKFYDNKYSVFGCFCSYNCAAAYNLKMDDSYMWSRYGLLKKLHNEIHKNNDDIVIAPPRESFDKFGGPVSWNEYRKNCIRCTKEYRFIMPPMTSIVPLIEEGQMDGTKVSISLADLNKKSKLSRTKPLPTNRSTLFDSLITKK